MDMHPFMIITSLLFCFTAITKASTAMTPVSTTHNQNRPPLIAHIAGITVGEDSEEMLARRFGNGNRWTGEHPNGAQSWNFKHFKLYLGVDGFEYNNRGQIIDSVDLSSDDQPTNPGKSTHLRRANLLFAGKVAIGMSKSQVLRLLKNDLPAPTKQANKLRWEMKGLSIVHTPSNLSSGFEYTDWTAELTFNHNKLVEVNIECN